MNQEQSFAWDGHRDRLRCLAVSDPINDQRVAAYPGQTAETLRFTLGAPKAFAISPDGQQLLYLRSDGPRDKVHRLRRFDLRTGSDALLVDPLRLRADESLSDEERARRERLRESGAGITAFSTDSAQTKVAFALSGELFVSDLKDSVAWPVNGSILDPRLSPNGKYVGYANTAGEFRVTDGVNDRALCSPEGDNVAYGVAEFVAAEEMNRSRGFWWSPDSSQVLVARVDESPVKIWHISDPAFPEKQPRAVRYPAAGTDNALVTLWLVDVETGTKEEVQWDHNNFEYLITVNWSSWGPALVHVMSRDQRKAQILALTGTTARVVAEQSDSAWIDVIVGTPAWGPEGQLITTTDSTTTRHLAIDGKAVTPEGIVVSSIVDIDRFGITFAATEEPIENHLYWYGWGGELEKLTSDAGVHIGRAAGHTLVVQSRSLKYLGPKTVVHRDGQKYDLESLHEVPALDINVEILHLGPSELRCALVLPKNHNGEKLPLLVDSYGGPHAQRVVASKNAYAESQWFAEQGFAVLVVDGRGTPARGPQWEREVYLDLATAVLEDQVAAVEALIERGLVDPARVAIKGWSFGGYLSALAVLRRPDLFAAGIAGAPVTDWTLYDTFYTERYLAPDASAAPYAKSSLLNDAPEKKNPLLIIHGLVDDNVVVAHALRLSQHLLETGHPHQVLPLTGITHMPNRVDVATNMLTMMVDFLKNSLR